MQCFWCFWLFLALLLFSFLEITHVHFDMGAGFRACAVLGRS
jgi:hypothetical protein